MNIGAYRPGTNARIDRSLQMIQPIRDFLRQDIDEMAEPQDTLASLAELALVGRSDFGEAGMDHLDGTGSQA